MEEKHDFIFRTLGNQVVKTALESKGDDDKPAQRRQFLVILGILIFVGVEAVRAVFRKDFSVSTESLIRFILCFLCFGGISALSFLFMNSQGTLATQTGTQESHFVMAIIFSILSVFTLTRGIIQFVKTQKASSNISATGKSYLLGFLAKDGWTSNKIQNLAEPLLTLVVGIALCFYDLIGGIPIIFCALSVWLFLLFDPFFKETSMQQTVDRLNSKAASDDSFNEINTDF